MALHRLATIQITLSRSREDSATTRTTPCTIIGRLRIKKRTAGEKTTHLQPGQRDDARCFFATEDKEGTTCDAKEGWFGEELASHFEWVAPDQKMCMLHRVESNWATVSNVDTGDNYFSATWIFRLRDDFTQAG
jgi:hypothetical protein